MGLEKSITLPNGVELTYHRIVSMYIVTNQETIIEVASYTSHDKRIEEQEDEELIIDTKVEARSITCPYDEGMTIEDAYGFLKTLPEFSDAEDVLEDEEV